jgi:hypothetical protein
MIGHGRAGSRVLVPKKSVENAFQRTVGDLLAEHGFVRAGRKPLFHHWSPAGDAVLVEAQPTFTPTPGAAGHFLNVGLVVGPMWESAKRRRGLPPGEPPSSTALFNFNRLRLPGQTGEDLWETTEERLPSVTALLSQAFEEQLPRYLRALDREATAARADEIFQASGWKYRAWILADRGPSEELNELLDQAKADGKRAVHLDRIREWAESVTPN